MKQYISEDRAIYEDMYQGTFSKKLAEFAIRHMEVRDAATKAKKRLLAVPLGDMMDVLRENGVDVPEEHIYTAWYLYNMCKADYPRTCSPEEQRSTFVDETLNDPDGCAENVLDCFVTKMRNAGVALHWDRFC